ncbi:Chlorophyll A-B binding protein [Mayamaea pseudoterrestris]|nr:Chlorophyll A-B binding protein [Mayamaea pseudoterrestris]
MKRSLALSCILAVSASAFAPQKPNIKSTSQLANDLWNADDGKGGKNTEMSKALPFAPRPKLLDGSLPADVGFDPFGFAGSDKASLMYMREAEVKHSRLAMLAAIGWPLAELFDKPIADAAGLPTLLTKSGESPSVLNGGLDRIDVVYWIACVLLAGIVELEGATMRETKGKSYIIGDCGLSSLLPKDNKSIVDLQTKEIKNGRLAMMGILGFAVQEALYGKPVIEQTAFFFHPAF